MIVIVCVSSLPSSSVTLTVNSSVPLKLALGEYVQLPLLSMVAVPLAAAVSSTKLSVEYPSGGIGEGGCSRRVGVLVDRSREVPTECSGVVDLVDGQGDRLRLFVAVVVCDP